MKRLDQEIYEIEQRLHLREAELKDTAEALKHRTMKGLMSPLSIVGAVGLGFVVAGSLGRRKASKQTVSPETKEQTKGFALGSVLMTGAMWFVRQQFGGPVGLARFVVDKVRHRKPAYPQHVA